ncbi:MAG TPA: hypothetical protein VEA80_01640 [Vitreimonas sp.]|uniref:hypothetical protein n=1 Tax=Vitreimonas sp. TaxID=3069702 RepID=UPI002D5BE424|nr:hypothetical protein [Vitreimonas sp.]HYD86152.1 hypothetical protein [Vitreimonas sp.]
MKRPSRRAFAAALAAAALPARAGAQSNARSAAQAFADLKALAGDWQGRTESGRTFLVNYRLIANETVLIETWTMSPTRQSMTVYHMDGGDLLATHYCPIGNQPRLRYRPDLSGERLEFSFRDATNLQDASAAHQHAFWVRINAGGAFVRNETYIENGEAGSETASFSRIAQP